MDSKYGQTVKFWSCEKSAKRFEKNGTKLNPRAIGATYPTPSFIKAFAKVDGKVSLAPIYMGRSFSLIKQTMRPKEHHGLHSHELYMMLGEYKQKSQFFLDWGIDFDRYWKKTYIDFITLLLSGCFLPLSRGGGGGVE